MSIIKQIQERRRQLDELSKKTLGSYVKKAAASIDDHARDATAAYHRAANAEQKGDVARADKMDDKKKAHDRASANRQFGITRAVKRLTREEVEQLDEAQMGEIVKKLAHHGYKKFGDTDRVDHKTNLSHFRHAEKGHLICVDHTDHGRVKSASALKCTNSHTGEMHHSWGQEHEHVEHALSELGHKSYVGLKEDEQIDEISMETTRSYLNKAIKDKHRNALAYGRDGDFSHVKDEIRLKKRDKGIAIAHNKIKAAREKGELKEEIRSLLRKKDINDSDA